MAGGVMNMVLRSGTNQYHGELFEYVRNNVIDSRAFFDPEKLKLNRHQYGATFHGRSASPSSTTVATGLSSCSVGKAIAS